MSDLMVFNAVKMNSFEIAELLGNRHDKVKQSIERMAQRGIIQLPPMGKVENKQSLSPNRFVNVYILKANRANEIASLSWLKTALNLRRGSLTAGRSLKNRYSKMLFQITVTRRSAMFLLLLKRRAEC